jgi:DNA-binding transcriptional MocR family regulator
MAFVKVCWSVFIPFHLERKIFMHMLRFPKNDIISLVGEAPRYDLGESVGPDLPLAELLDAPGQANLGEMPLGYATAAGDPQLRRAIADAHGVNSDDVVVTLGGMHALFLIAFLLCDRGAEVVTTAPLFPPARTALDVVGANVRILPLKVLEQRERLVAERRRTLARTAEWVLENKELVDWVQPDAGALCCVRLKPTVFDDVAVSRFYDALASAGVRVANGTWFGDEERVFRLGFGLLSLPDLQVALNVLSASLKQTMRADA